MALSMYSPYPPGPSFLARSHMPLPPGAGMAMDVTLPAASDDLLAPTDSVPMQQGSGGTTEEPVFPRNLPPPEWRPMPVADPF